jgi:hypothetical protein
MADLIDKGREAAELYVTLLQMRKLAKINPQKWGPEIAKYDRALMELLQEYDNPPAFTYALDKIFERAKNDI